MFVLPDEMEHKVLKHGGYHSHTQTDAGDAEGHRSNRSVIQLKLFNRNILKVLLAGKCEAMMAKRLMGVTVCLTF